MTTKVPQMSQTEIENDIALCLQQIARAKELEVSGYYKDNEIKQESIYAGDAMSYAQLGMAYALHNDIAEAQTAFRTAAELQSLPIRMAYDTEFDNYQGSVIVRGAEAYNVVDCASYALAADTIEIAQLVCAIFPKERPKTPEKTETIDEFVFALDAFFKGELSKAANICETRIEKFLAKPSKKITFNSNYYTLHLALWGICTGDQQSFDEGIRKQLTICHHEARYGEWKGMVPGHYAEYAVALTNLAILAGLKQQVFDPFIPQGLVWSKSDRD